MFRLVKPSSLEYTPYFPDGFDHKEILDGCLKLVEFGKSLYRKPHYSVICGPHVGIKARVYVIINEESWIGLFNVDYEPIYQLSTKKPHRETCPLCGDQRVMRWDMIQLEGYTIMNDNGKPRVKPIDTQYTGNLAMVHQYACDILNGRVNCE